MLIGYARTSTAEQNAGLAAQERDLTAAGAERVFKEQVSSVAARAVLAECLGFLRQGDVLVVTKPDRLARSTAELLTIEADLSKRGIGLVVLSMGGERLDTRNPTSKLMLTILAGVATWEREIMLERQREGIAKAKAEGKYKGRPQEIDAEQVKVAIAAGETPTQLARRLGVARSSVYRMLNNPPGLRAAHEGWLVRASRVETQAS
jgi:DNA invertase Pin-like site-specific DNA recombinase